MAKVISTAEFQAEVLDSATPVIVDFFATWCMPCKMIAPVLEEISNEMAGKVKVVKVDIDEDGELANKFSVRSVPTMIFFKGGTVCDQILGAVPKSAIVSKLEQII